MIATVEQQQLAGAEPDFRFGLKRGNQRSEPPRFGLGVVVEKDHDVPGACPDSRVGGSGELAVCGECNDVDPRVGVADPLGSVVRGGIVNHDDLIGRPGLGCNRVKARHEVLASPIGRDDNAYREPRVSGSLTRWRENLGGHRQWLAMSVRCTRAFRFQRSLPSLQDRDTGDGANEGCDREYGELTGGQWRVAQEPEEREQHRGGEERQLTPVGATAQALYRAWGDPWSPVAALAPIRTVAGLLDLRHGGPLRVACS